MQSHQSRKRPAPGTSPSSRPTQDDFEIPTMTDVQMPGNVYNDWTDQNIMGQPVASYPKVPTYSDPYAPVANSTQSLSNISNQLIRRSNQGLASREGQYENDGWLDDGNTQVQTTTWDEVTDEEDLEQKALAAKKDAQGKRKTIPPFVQKLSSFLDESNNTDLIRWSEDGNSFIVLDEDEFANTLIPELFKSNKYASFVRQLNMYGFHKKVGLSDNSMRASEKKAKNPSEFYNPYFKRGRPELLWLIHKPKSGTPHPKRKREDPRAKPGGDSSDEDKKIVEPSGADRGQLKQVEPSSIDQSQELATLPSSDLQNLRQELQALQRQQRFISKVITQVREQNHQLYQQATAFQALHDRHENSISAILTFLATFYNRNVEGMGAPNLASMFANAIPQNNQPRGTVEDMGDYGDSDANPSNQLQRVVRKPQLLLPPPTAKSSASRITTESPDPSPGTRQTPSSGQTLNSARPATQPRQTLSHAQSSGNKEQNNVMGPDASATDIMALIKDANASAATPTNDGSFQDSTSFDFPAALSHFQSANGHTPLTPQERDNMLALMAKEQNGSNLNTTQGSNNANSNNALVTPNPPPMPSLENFAANQQQLDMLQRLQQEQDAKVQSLADRLQPLSPTGSIPGLHNGNNYSGIDGNPADLGPPSDLDLNNFISNGDYFTGQGQTDVGLGDPAGNGNSLFDPPSFDMDFGDPDNTGLGGGGDFDIGAGDGSGLNDAGWTGDFPGQNLLDPDLDGKGRIVESVSSEAASPAPALEEGTYDDRGATQTDGRGPKKRRLA